MDKFNRFKGATWFPKEETYCLVGGAGGISSWLTVLLNRAGFKTFVYDFDLIEEHNLGGQLFFQNQIGKSKVEALAEVTKLLTKEDIHPFNQRYDKSSMTNNYCFAGFDNMAAREVMFNKWMAENEGNSNSIFIDGRLLMEQLQIFCIQGDDGGAIKSYQGEHLFGDSEVEDAPCSLKQTSHSAAMIASHMIGFFTNFIANLREVEKGNMKVRSVPFFWEYFIPVDLLTLSNPNYE